MIKENQSKNETCKTDVKCKTGVKQKKSSFLQSVLRFTFYTSKNMKEEN